MVLLPSRMLLAFHLMLGLAGWGELIGICTGCLGFVEGWGLLYMLGLVGVLGIGLKRIITTW